MSSNKKIILSGIFSAGYGIVPKKLMQAHDISGTTKLVLVYLLTYTGAGRTSYPPQEQIARDLSITARTVRRCIGQAKRAGYLATKRKFLGRGYGSHNEYDMLFMADSPIKQDTRVRSKAFREDICDHLERTPEHHNNKQLKYIGARAQKKKSIYPDMRPMDEE